MRTAVVTGLVVVLLSAGCGKYEPRRERDEELSRKSTTFVEHPEIKDDSTFAEGYEVVVQFRDRGGWSKPKSLARGATASHRAYFGSAVRLTVCESICGDPRDIVERPEAIRCQVRANQRPGKTSQLRLTPHLVRDRDGDIGCEWTGSGIVADHCAPSVEFHGPVDRRRLVSPAQLSTATGFKFVERHGCTTSAGGIRFTKMGWAGSLDCNSAAGRWRMGPGRRVRIGVNSSTLVGCTSPLDIDPERIAYVERLPSGDVRLLDETWFPLAVGAPERDVPGN